MIIKTKHSDQLTIVRDTREQKRQDKALGWMFDHGFDPAPVVITRGLPTGDYSLLGLENDVIVERKTLPDLIACLGRERERFENELLRMRGFASAVVIVEALFDEVAQGNYRSKLNPKCAVQTVISFCANYRIPFFFCKNGKAAERCAFDFLRHYHTHFKRKIKAVLDAK